MIDREKILEGVKLILEGIGEDPNREGLLDTPDRIARMYEEIFSGIGKEAEDELSKTFTVEGNDLVLEKDITSCTFLWQSSYCIYTKRKGCRTFKTCKMRRSLCEKTTITRKINNRSC